MSRIDPLHELIHALTKSEKRYFKLFAGLQGNDKKYILLFDAIDRQSDYNEEELKERFRTEKFVRQFSVAKNYLRSLIMKSLRLYHSDSTVRYQLRELMMDIEILADKRLNHQAWKLSCKVVDLAREQGRPAIELEGLVRKHGLEPQTTMTREGLDRMASEQRSAVERIEELVDFGLLIYETARLASRGNTLRSAEELAELDSIMAHPRLASLDGIHSVRSRARYHWIHAADSIARGDYEKALIHNHALLHLFDDHPVLLPEYISLYNAAISNTLFIYQLKHDYEQFHDVLQKFRSPAFESLKRLKRRSRDESTIFALYYTHVLAFSIQMGNYRSAYRLIDQIEQGLPKHTPFFDQNSQTRLFLSMAFASLACREYRRGLDFINIILYQTSGPEGRSIRQVAEVAVLLFHYEMGNRQLLKHLVPTTRRTLESNGPLLPYEEIVLSLIDRLIHGRKSEEEVAPFREAASAFALHMDNPHQRIPLETFPFGIWLASKESGTSMEKIGASSPYYQEMPEIIPPWDAASPSSEASQRAKGRGTTMGTTSGRTSATTVPDPESDFGSDRGETQHQHVVLSQSGRTRPSV